MNEREKSESRGSVAILPPGRWRSWGTRLSRLLPRRASQRRSSVIAAPFLWNGNMNTGPDSSRVQTEVLVEPRAPFSIAEDWVRPMSTISQCG